MNSGIAQYCLALCITAILLGCGTFKPTDRRQALDGNGTGGKPVSLSLVANYEISPVDILLVKEENGVFRSNDYPFAKRLYSQQDQSVAYKDLAVKIFNSALDFQFGIMSSTFSNGQGAANNGGILYADATNANQIMVQKTGFITDAYTRMSRDRGSASLSYPLTSIKRLLERSHESGSPSEGFVREDAKLAILYVGIFDEIEESYDTADFIKLMDNVKGAGNWKVSAIVPDATGCAYRLRNDTPRHTNDFYEQDPTKVQSYLRRNKVLKLQEHTGGLFRSICEREYLSFINDFIGEGTSSAFFSIELELPADPATIEIRVNKSIVTGWRYHAKDQLLEVPTTIPSGTTFTLNYSTPMEKLKEEIYDSKEDIESIPDVQDVELSPAKIAFLNDVRPVLLANCTTGGCHGNAFNAGIFEEVWTFRASIVERVNRDPAAAGYMPQAPNILSADDKDLILNWINTYD